MDFGKADVPHLAIPCCVLGGAHFRLDAIFPFHVDADAMVFNENTYISVKTQQTLKDKIYAR
jgi:hypothetical protein